MSEGKPTYNELETMYIELQNQVTRFSAVEQNLINTKDSLDRELARFKTIQSYSEKAIHAKSLKDFATITVESIIEVFEVECSMLLKYDKTTKSLKFMASFDFEKNVEELPLDMDWIAAKNLLHGRGRVVIEQPHPTKDPWSSLGLCQVIFRPYYDEREELEGFVLGGRTVKNQSYYDELKNELIP